MMDEIIKFDRYVEQAKLLTKYRIDTDGQLGTLKEAVQSEIDVLTDKRKALYAVRRRNPEEETLSADLLSINQSIKTLRHELRVCERIEASIPVIRQKLKEPAQHPQKTKSPRHAPISARRGDRGACPTERILRRSAPRQG